ncbi:MAG: hypothetical protein P4L82_16025 [Ancalomicrobiaceae bacterium]|nr:hypothetical protein [Ancalomicrobiaceae bacterium]
MPDFWPSVKSDDGIPDGFGEVAPPDAVLPQKCREYVGLLPGGYSLF